MKSKRRNDPNRIHVGTSGWAYKHWRGPFYPKRDPESQSLLQFYSQFFSTVELNNSFYHLPSAAAFNTWKKTTPEKFIFAVKASRFITHMKKLKGPKPSIKKFFSRIGLLGPKLGPVLFQMPPHWKVNTERLENFLQALPAGHQYAFEFRHASWFSKEVYALLEKYGAGFCIYEIAGTLSPLAITSDLVYVRLHGPADTAYQGSYSCKALEDWAAKIRKWSKAGKEVFFYFDNDQLGYAAQNAVSLQKMAA